MAIMAAAILTAIGVTGIWKHLDLISYHHYLTIHFTQLHQHLFQNLSISTWALTTNSCHLGSSPPQNSAQSRSGTCFSGERRSRVCEWIFRSRLGGDARNGQMSHTAHLANTSLHSHTASATTHRYRHDATLRSTPARRGITAKKSRLQERHLGATRSTAAKHLLLNRKR